ncbi:uncharacterized protein BXZ73DRAFT_98686 [Epithele typhae]|uniref:uncharacterized protein n=1 Tax=Epithele typhae TaxID=378194 RepID=UPI002007A4E6|nr:uncharacterized protein BXZ73DRAFT_98686 [Epithele typhae]KAH9940853.1 hypothetical protein BXZ73DRAFT_98686 [Epithele typhae]
MSYPTLHPLDNPRAISPRRRYQSPAGPQPYQHPSALAPPVPASTPRPGSSRVPPSNRSPSPPPRVSTPSSPSSSSGSGSDSTATLVAPRAWHGTIPLADVLLPAHLQLTPDGRNWPAFRRAVRAHCALRRVAHHLARPRPPPYRPIDGPGPGPGQNQSQSQNQNQSRGEGREGGRVGGSCLPRPSEKAAWLEADGIARAIVLYNVRRWPCSAQCACEFAWEVWACLERAYAVRGCEVQTGAEAGLAPLSRADRDYGRTRTNGAKGSGWWLFWAVVYAVTMFCVFRQSAPASRHQCPEYAPFT